MILDAAAKKEKRSLELHRDDEGVVRLTDDSTLKLLKAMHGFREDMKDCMARGSSYEPPEVTIVCDLETLRGVQYVDLPGLGENDTLNEILVSSDLILFVGNGEDHGWSKKDARLLEVFLSNCVTLVDKMIYVVNKPDKDFQEDYREGGLLAYSAEERLRHHQELKESVLRKLQGEGFFNKQFPRSRVVFNCANSVVASKYESGYYVDMGKKFCNLVFSTILQKKIQGPMLRHLEKTLRAVARPYDRVHGLLKGEYDKAAQIEAMKEAIKRLRTEAPSFIEEVCGRLVDTLSKRVGSFRETLIKMVNEMDDFPKTTSVSSAEQAISAHLGPWLSNKIAEVKRSFFEEFNQEVRKIIQKEGKSRSRNPMSTAALVGLMIGTTLALPVGWVLTVGVALPVMVLLLIPAVIARIIVAIKDAGVDVNERESKGSIDGLRTQVAKAIQKRVLEEIPKEGVAFQKWANEQVKRIENAVEDEIKALQKIDDHEEARRSVQPLLRAEVDLLCLRTRLQNPGVVLPPALFSSEDRAKEKGGQGWILKAESEGSAQAAFAVKVFRKTTAKDCLLGNLREIHFLNKFSSDEKMSEYFATFRGCVQGGQGELAFIMDFYEDDLGKVKMRADFTGLQRLRLFAQVAEGMRLLHDKGVSHRDLKPENILLSSDRSQAKIVDFGLAEECVVSSETRGGSPTYVDPCVRVGLSKPDCHLDCYSFGVTVAEVWEKKDPLALCQSRVTKAESELTADKLLALYKDFRNKGQSILGPLQKTHGLSIGICGDVQDLVKGCTVLDPSVRFKFVEIAKRLKVLVRRAEAEEKVARMGNTEDSPPGPPELRDDAQRPVNPLAPPPAAVPVRRSSRRQFEFETRGMLSHVVPGPTVLVKEIREWTEGDTHTWLARHIAWEDLVCPKGFVYVEVAPVAKRGRKHAIFIDDETWAMSAQFGLVEDGVLHPGAHEDGGELHLRVPYSAICDAFLRDVKSQQQGGSARIVRVVGSVYNLLTLEVSGVDRSVLSGLKFCVEDDWFCCSTNIIYGFNAATMWEDKSSKTGELHAKRANVTMLEKAWGGSAFPAEVVVGPPRGIGGVCVYLKRPKTCAGGRFLRFWLDDLLPPIPLTLAGGLPRSFVMSPYPPQEDMADANRNLPFGETHRVAFTFSDLPPEIVEDEVLPFLDFASLILFSSTCHSWREIGVTPVCKWTKPPETPKKILKNADLYLRLNRNLCAGSSTSTAWAVVSGWASGNEIVKYKSAEPSAAEVATMRDTCVLLESCRANSEVEAKKARSDPSKLPRQVILSAMKIAIQCDADRSVKFLGEVCFGQLKTLFYESKDLADLCVGVSASQSELNLVRVRVEDFPKTPKPPTSARTPGPTDELFGVDDEFEVEGVDDSGSDGDFLEAEEEEELGEQGEGE